MKSIIINYCILTAFFICIITQSFSQPHTKPTPSFEEVLSLRSASDPKISPNGKMIAFTVRSTDWKNNRYDEEIWLYNGSEAPFQLTNTHHGSSTAPQWSYDNKWIAFLADRGDKKQIYIIRANGGEAQQVTNEREEISSYAWSPVDLRIVFTKEEKSTEEEKRKKEKYGEFTVEGEEYHQSHLWVVQVKPDMWPRPEEKPCYQDDIISDSDQSDCIQLPQPERLTQGNHFTVSNFTWSPDGQKIAFQRQRKPDIDAFMTADISIVNLKDKEVNALVKGPGFDGNPVWSPDGKWVAFGSNAGDTVSNIFKNLKVFKIASDGSGEPIPLAMDVDENIMDLKWNPTGMYAIAQKKTNSYMYSINPNSGKSKAILKNPENIFSFSFSLDGSQLALLGRKPATLTEVYTTSTRDLKPIAVSNMTRQIEDWRLGSSEVIQWKSKDGLTIEGVLHKPANYDPQKKYPLMVVIHGGPAATDTPVPVLSYVYPVNQWINKGALVLRPNYRGSAGYGEEFRSENVRNLGIGDSWDVLSGVDFLADKGIIDTTRMAAMGWSQGGYIAAFLATHTDRFKAISVGAGISNWVTYYTSTDIQPFTRQYLQADPWTDPEIYARTSPITAITNASTPTLIQHGENDKRVPVANAYELYQGLQDMRVPAKLIIYKGFGHGIDKPKERLAAVWHNWQWFARYIWEENIDMPAMEANLGK